MLELFPALFEFDESKANCNVHQKIEENEMSCLLLNNMGEILTNIIIFTVVKCLAFGFNAWRKHLKYSKFNDEEFGEISTKGSKKNAESVSGNKRTIKNSSKISKMKNKLGLVDDASSVN